MKDHENPEEYFPCFMWLLRDFHLQIKDTEGNPLKPIAYLENALQEIKGTSEAVEQKNKARRQFK